MLRVAVQTATYQRMAVHHGDGGGWFAVSVVPSSQFRFLFPPTGPSSKVSIRRHARPQYPSQSTNYSDSCHRRRIMTISLGSQTSSDSTTENSATLRRSKNSTMPAPAPPEDNNNNPELQCISTGTNVECVIPNGETADNNLELQCIGTGTDVECVISNGEATENSDIVAMEYLSSDTLNSSESASLLNGTDEFSVSSYAWLKSSWEYLLLISPFFFWGTSMVAMKGVLPKAGPLFVATTRLIPSGFLLVGFAKLQNRKQPSGINAWLAITLFALVDGSCFQGFLAEGLKRTTAGLGSVIIDSQPLTVAVLASILFGEAIGALGILGLAAGVVGLLLLEVPTQLIEDFFQGHVSGMVSESSNIGNGWSIWDSGEWWMLLAAQSMAVGTVMVRWVCRFSDPVMATGWHMVIGGIPLLILAVIQRDPAVSGHIQDLDFSDWLSLSYTFLFGSAVSYGVFFYNASRGSLTKLSSLTFLTPMFAALFGYLLLNETLNSTQILGAMITVASIYLINARTLTKDDLS